jgi:hypothetical protein
MQTAIRDLIIAAAGAVVGAVLINVLSQWTTRSRETRRQRTERELAEWQSADPLKRQRLFNAYLFSVLKFFIIGSILTVIGNVMSDLEPNQPGLSNFNYIDAVIDGAAALFYFATLVEILDFTKLVRQH